MVATLGAGGNAAAAAVTDRRFSTVVPAEVTGDSQVRELADMDLALKLHYLRLVHYFPAGSAAAGLTVPELKYPMFRLLDAYYPACGRIRRPEESGGRPVVKCNDSGVRVVEARCALALDEWLATAAVDQHRHVAPDKVLGPEMHFSPLVLVQFTRFKCGGLAIGFSWSHLLGDAVSATNFIKMYGQFLSGNPPPKPQQPPATVPEKPAPAAATPPLSTREVKTPQDCWLPTNELKMASFSFRISGSQVELLRSKASGRTPFEAISALIWRCLAKLRSGHGEPRTISICKTNPSAARRSIMSNEQTIGVVRAGADDLPPSQAPLSELAALIAEGFVDETGAVEGQVAAGTAAGPDLLFYGANLTFVDMEGIEAYGLEVKGRTPVFVNYSIEGVGDEGAVLVFQGPKATAEENAAGRTVNVILPEDEVLQLRKELEENWGIA
ncbi:hypothetical protein Taro_006213 [Colocasia esculenta]|uniref:Uncharacterized protein n=1 Tax=Colocasia esculenta TaxID=4460 RepID=A0A843U026_COLES|nr:hypothetical protein [Colocasia esculenta]